VASHATAAVAAMMPAHVCAVVLAACRGMSHDRQRRHAHRHDGDQQATERMGKRFHGTTLHLSYGTKPTLFSLSKSGAARPTMKMAAFWPTCGPDRPNKQR
jgi:hypothetical protein